ncbi:hypothetical protein K6W12_27250 [Burkholderia multivorans]|uniref:hypothetical protein n=1 Tax=Burkholderia multivorans TaxID=87883 RepID=UPI001C975B07|nr:hypothetical protein [Burkholderia multivorans]MBY4674324.1 hypothetical protein [Burkholderia multivorans]
MGRQKLTDEERAQRREARLEKAREKRAEAAALRESKKAAIRSEIEGLASVIPLLSSRPDNWGFGQPGPA